MSAKRSRGFKDHIRNPRVIWYGPHGCPNCGQMIVKASTKDGGMSLDAPHGHHYPNHKWTEHRCKTRKKVGEIIMDGKTHEARLGQVAKKLEREGGRPPGPPTPPRPPYQEVA